jgi:hypothetical protein
VVALFNWDKEAEATVVLPDALGLDPNVQYAGYNFWENTFVEAFQGPQAYTLRPSSCRVVALHRVLDRPQLLGTSRHITQGAVDLVSVTWNAETKTLEGVSRLVANDPYVLHIRMPECWRVDRAESSVCEPIISQEGCRLHLRVRLDSPTTTEATWRVVFAR